MSFIATTTALIRELRKLEDDFITVKVNGEEYVIESVIREKTHSDNGNETHLCLLCRDGGQGCVKR